jgi:ubiquinone/menaquinone biosynthesis C-methylase UbiE
MAILAVIGKILLGIIAFMLLWLTLAKPVKRFFKIPAPAFTGRFLDSKFRRWMQPPGIIVRRSGIREGMQVLEIGCGSGCFTTYVARAVVPQGNVYALDIQEKMLAQLKKKLDLPAYSDIKNIELLHRSAYDLPFGDNTLDLVYMITVLQEIPDSDKALSEVRRVLTPGGHLAITEFFPDPDYPRKSTTIKQCQKVGFKLDRLQGNFFNYTARFRKE